MRLVSLVIAVLILAPLSALAAPYQAYPEAGGGGGDTFRVVTGDTLVLNGQVVHLAGIRAPAASQLCGSGRDTWACGQVARDQLSREIGDAPLTCDSIRETRDGRAVASCTTASGDNLSAWMIYQGLALVSPEAPEAYQRVQEYAREHRLGVWRTATMTRNDSYNGNTYQPAYNSVNPVALPSAGYAPNGVGVPAGGFTNTTFDPQAVVSDEGMTADGAAPRPTFRGMACAVLHKGC